jgi:hypothetical protein
VIIIFPFKFKMLKKSILKIKLSIIEQIIFTLHKMSHLTKCNKCKWNIDLKKFSLVEPWKIFVCYQIMNIIIIIYQIFNMKWVLNTILIQLVSNVLSTYFYDTKVVQILYPTSHKLNVRPMVLHFYFKIFSISFVVSIKNYSIF